MTHPQSKYAHIFSRYKNQYEITMFIELPPIVENVDFGSTYCFLNASQPLTMSCISCIKKRIYGYIRHPLTLSVITNILPLLWVVKKTGVNEFFPLKFQMHLYIIRNILKRK